MSTPITVLGITSQWPSTGETGYANQTLQLQQSLAAAVEPISGLFNSNTGIVGNLSLSDSNELLVNGVPVGASAGVVSFNARQGVVTLNSGDVAGALGYTPGTVSSVTVAGTAGQITSSGSPLTTSGTITLGLATTTVTPGTYNTANITVDAYGRITAATTGPGGVTSFNTRTGAITLTSSDVTTALGYTPGSVTSVSGANGVTVANPTTTPVIGLGAITPTSVAASGTVTGSNLSGTNTGDQTLNSLLPSQTGNSGKFLTTNGTNSSWGAITGVVTTFSAGSTGLTPSTATSGAITLGGTLSVANGGTGATSTTSAFDALSPLTTLGDMLTYNGADNIRLPISGANLFAQYAVLGVQTYLGQAQLPSWQDSRNLSPRYLTVTDYPNQAGTQPPIYMVFSDALGTQVGQTYTSTGAPYYSVESNQLIGAFQGSLQGNVDGNILGGAAGTLVYQSAANTTDFLAIGSTDQVLTVSGGLPVWANRGGVISFNTRSGAVTLLSSDVTSALGFTPGVGTVTSVSGTAGRISSTGGATPVLDLETTAVTAGSYTNTNITVDAYGRITSASNGSAGGVTSVTATAPLASTGGATPDISITQATTTTDGYLSSTNWNTFNGKANSGVNSDITSLTGITGVITAVASTSQLDFVNGANTPIIRYDENGVTGYNSGADTPGIDVSVRAGYVDNASSGPYSGGSLSLTAGNGNGTGASNGGNVIITAGSATAVGNGDGGNVAIEVGANSASTAGGTIRLSTFGQSLEILNSGAISLNSNAGTAGQALVSAGSGSAATWSSLDNKANSGANSDITSLSGITGLVSTATGVDFNTTTPATVATGRLSWNTADATLNLGLDSQVTLQIGQEQLLRIHNNSGGSFTDGQIVYVNGSSGNFPTIALAKADSELTSKGTIGMVTETITNGTEGFVTILGAVRNINTAAFTDGDVLYLSAATAGAYTNVPPAAPNHAVSIGYVVRAHATVGQVYVKVDNGYELDELHNVTITNPLDGEVLQFDNTLNTWANRAVYTTATTPPSTPKAGDVWVNSDNGIEYVYYTDGDTSQWVQFAGSSVPQDLSIATLTTTGTTNIGGDIVMPNAAGHGIKLDNDTPAFGWADLIGPINVRGSGATDPAWAVFRTNINAYQFAVNDECWLTFHVPHDWVPGSDMFLHVHWAHNSASVTTGAVTFTAHSTFAKGFNQEAFPATKSITITQNASTVQYQHMVAESQLSTPGGSATLLDSSAIEVDGLILVRLVLTADTISAATDPFVFTADIHYQSTGFISTKNKAPNFYN